MDQISSVYGTIEEYAKKAEAKLGRKAVIQVASSSTVNDWTMVITNTATKGVKDAGFEVINTNANRDNNKLVSDIENGISRKVDGIIVVGGYAATLAEVLKKAKAAGIQIVTLDVPSEDIVTNVTSDSFGGSALVAMKMCMDMGGSGNIVVGHSAGWHAFDLRRAMLDVVLMDFPNVKIANEIVLNRADIINSTEASMENVLQKFPKGEIKAGYFVYGLPAIGASNAIAKTGRTEIGLYNADADKLICKEMLKENSPFKACYGQSITVMGNTAVLCLYKAIAGESQDIKRQTFVPISLVTKDNAKEFGMFNYPDFEK
jgi:ABC-type sugar transport system substrate-binding protein